MKNKKLLILLCIPLIIAVMVLPLCSFTTVYVPDYSNNDYITLSSISNPCVNYNYYYGSTGVYLGRLNQCARVLTNFTGDWSNQNALNNSIKYTASDYYVTSSSRIIIDDNESGIDVIDGKPYRLSMFYKTNDNTRVQFPISVYVENLSEHDNLQYGFYHGSGSDYYLFNIGEYDMSIMCAFTYIYTTVNRDTGEISVQRERIIHSVPSGNDNEEFDGWFFAPYDAVEFLIQEYYHYIWDDPDFLYGYVADFSADITVSTTVNGVTSSTNVCDAVMVMSNVYDTTTEFYNLAFNHSYAFIDSINPIYSTSYLEGYNRGYNYGLSNAKSVWGTITDFLTTTIGGFFDMHITPTITISSMLGIILSVTLVVAFLKIFAGG